MIVNVNETEGTVADENVHLQDIIGKDVMRTTAGGVGTEVKRVTVKIVIGITMIGNGEVIVIDPLVVKEARGGRGGIRDHAPDHHVATVSAILGGATATRTKEGHV